MEKTILKFPKNDSVAYFLTINKIEKELDSAYMTVKENPDDTEPLIKKSLGAGISLVDNRLYKNQLSYKIQLDGADTQFMEVGVRYFFDIKGTIGNAQKTFRAGELILSETETGYLNPATTGETTMIAQVFETDFATGAQSEYVETEVDPVAMKKIGDMTKLDTTEKGTIVKAINEVKKAVDDAETPLFTEATARENIESGEKQPTLWGKVKKWFSSLKALAFKDKVGTNDFEADAKCPIAEYASTDKTKGSIEERLNRLGFKEGYFTLTSGSMWSIYGNSTETTQLKVTREGNYVHIPINPTKVSNDSSYYYIQKSANDEWTDGSVIGNVDNDFIPDKDEYFLCYAVRSRDGSMSVGTVRAVTLRICGKGYANKGKIVVETFPTNLNSTESYAFAFPIAYPGYDQYRGGFEDKYIAPIISYKSTAE